MVVRNVNPVCASSAQMRVPRPTSRRLERELILRALEQTAGNRTHAAKLLDLSHRALLYKIKDYDIG